MRKVVKETKTKLPVDRSLPDMTLESSTENHREIGFLICSKQDFKGAYNRNGKEKRQTK